MNSRSDRLRGARLDAGYESARAAADAFGWNISAYRHHENGTRSFDVEAAKRYGRALKVNPGYLLGLDLVRNSKQPPPASYSSTVEVIGSVAAGVWHEGMEWDQEKRFTITVGSSPFPDARRFGLQVEGHSMDKEFPPGTILDCISIFDLGIDPESGDHVIVECKRADGLREYTVKRFHQDDDGRHWLWPESSRPEHQAPIEVGKPSNDASEDGEGVQVIAFVIGSYQPRSLRLLDRAKNGG